MPSGSRRNLGCRRVATPATQLLGRPRTLSALSQAFVGDHDISQPARLSFVGDMYQWPVKPYYSLDPAPAD